MASAGAQAFAAGSQVTADVAGTFQTLTNNVATFTEKFRLQLMQAGFDPIVVDVEARPWLERILDLDIIDEPYRARVVVRTLAPWSRTNVASAIGTAATKAGSYVPGVSILDSSDPAQPGVKPVGGLLGSIATAAGDVVAAAGQAAKEVPKLPTQLIIGILILGAFIAFGPNLRGIGRKL